MTGSRDSVEKIKKSFPKSIREVIDVLEASGTDLDKVDEFIEEKAKQRF